MRKHVLRLVLGLGYVVLLATLLLYQAGAFGARREWAVAVLGTLFLGGALAVVLWLYVRVNDQISGQTGRSEKEPETQAADRMAADDGADYGTEGSWHGEAGDGGELSALQSYEEIYARFLSAMEDCMLSERELEVAWLLYRGYTNRQIGEALYIAETTVKKHVSHIYQKMDVCSRKEFRGKVQAEVIHGSRSGG